MAASPALQRFEIYVGRGFAEFEVASITRTLQCANEVLGRREFQWRYVSEIPGLVGGSNGMIIRAEPAVKDHDLFDALIVVGGQSGKDGEWLPRMRQMSRRARQSFLLSDAATTFIKRTKPKTGNVTTHWLDAVHLNEIIDIPNFTNRLAEKSGSITTAAGSGSTMELVISLISAQMSLADVTEVGNRLLLPIVRKTQAEQPQDIATIPALADGRIKAAVVAMGESLDAPLSIQELANQVGISNRQLERRFKALFGHAPGKFYKLLRTKRARVLIQETQMPIIEIALATGFGSSNSLNTALKLEYGLTATKMRLNRD